MRACACIRVVVYVHAYVYILVFMLVCVCVCVYACVYVCVHIYLVYEHALSLHKLGRVANQDEGGGRERKGRDGAMRCGGVV